ncbi:hypothetical protein AMPC_39810 [Anaeromyxobacter paludicola]|uniref:histidine kinase n=1 Tax=Anaeromyxobacter paludicola TaxID=2918171 RepID=A0ABM7XG44_9BACT|nr:hypothetical protein AMPC_39810 [Anaeromyxobacter paludicola]
MTLWVKTMPLLLFAIGHFALLRAGDYLNTHHSDFGAFWPASGWFLAGLLLSKRDRWWRLAAAAMAAELASGALANRSLFSAAIYGAGDVLEASAGAWLLRRTLTRRITCERVPEVFGILALAALLSTTLSATIGTLEVIWRLPGRAFLDTWLSWWAGDGLGVLVIAPFVLSWTGRPLRLPSWRKCLEGLALAVSLGFAAAVVLEHGDGGLELQYVLLPFLVWAALRFGARGASAAAVLLAGVGAWCTSHGWFAVTLPDDSNLPLQLFLLVTVSTTLLLAAALSERLQAESALRESELRAEQASRLASLGTLAAGVAHEINNPLTFVSANLEYLGEQLAECGERRCVTGPELMAVLREAQQGASRVADIVRDLKMVSREVESRRGVVDLHDEVRDALRLTANEVRHRARLSVELGPVPPVEAPARQLGQVLVNLLVNASQAIPEGEASRHWIRVTTRTAADGRAEVEVADSGAGIPEALRARIFEPFFTTKPQGVGTGLGLSICSGIVGGLGGEIAFESEEGKGSVFRVLLPPCDGPGHSEAATAPAPGSPAAPPAAFAPASSSAPAGSSAPSAPKAAPATGAEARPAAARRGRVLVVDDEPLIGRSVRRMLAGHDVEVLTDGREALVRLLAGERFDLVLCDLMMPELTGMALEEKLRELVPEACAAMVYMTGGAFTPAARDFLAGGRCYLEKPFQSAELLGLLEQRLASPAPASRDA